MQFQPPHTFIDGQRLIWFKVFSDETGYAINLESPSGVFYFQREAIIKLKNILDQFGNPPMFPKDYQPDKIEKQILTALFGQTFTNITRNKLSAISQYKSPRMFSAWLHINNSCNLSCAYCYIPQLQKATLISNSNSQYNDQTINLVVRQLFETCQKNDFSNLQMTFAGGEPSMVPHIIEKICRLALSYSAKYRIEFTSRILTNGTIISPKFLDLLRKYSIRISISIDGNQETHNQIRYKYNFTKKKREGTYQTIFENIEKLKTIGIEPFILTTITRENFATVPDLVTECLNHQIGFRLSLVRDQQTANSNEIRKNILSMLIEVYRNLGKSLPIERPIHKYAQFAEWSLLKSKNSACGAGRNAIAIGQKGDISTCQMRLEKKQGNIGDKPLNEILNHINEDDESFFLVNPLKRDGECSQCLWRHTCAGGCPEHTKMVKGTYNAASPWCQVYGDFLPHYIEAVALQIKRAVDSKIYH